MGTSLLAAGFMASGFSGLQSGRTDPERRGPLRTGARLAQKDEKVGAGPRGRAKKKLAAKQQKVEESRQRGNETGCSAGKTNSKRRVSSRRKRFKSGTERRLEQAEDKAAKTEGEVRGRKGSRRLHRQCREARIKDADERIRHCSASSRKTSKAIRRRLPILKIDELKQARDRLKSELSKTKSAETLRWQVSSGGN